MSDAPPSRPVHVRTIRVEVAQAGPHELDVTATLVDERPGGNPEWFGATSPPVIHDMRLGLRVRHPDLVITAVRSEMASHPYTICPEALPPLGQLVGLSIARGFTRVVNERFGRQRGCAHFTALIHAMAPAVRQGAGVAFPEPTRPSATGSVVRQHLPGLARGGPAAPADPGRRRGGPAGALRVPARPGRGALECDVQANC